MGAKIRIALKPAFGDSPPNCRHRSDALRRAPVSFLAGHPAWTRRCAAEVLLAPLSPTKRLNQSSWPLTAIAP